MKIKIIQWNHIILLGMYIENQKKCSGFCSTYLLNGLNTKLEWCTLLLEGKKLQNIIIKPCSHYSPITIKS